MAFEGFSPETVDFLWGIRMNNNREWFLEHKQDYTRCLYEPMKALGAELFAPFMDKPGNLLKVSRIYRDARMHHPQPYKESLWICIRQDVEWWAENPCLFFEATPEGISYGFLWWQPGTQTLTDFRSAVAGQPRQFRELLAQTEAAVGIPVEAEHYKRPKPCDNPEIAEYFSWKGYVRCIAREDWNEETFGPALAQRVSAFLQGVMPLYTFCGRFAK